MKVVPVAKAKSKLSAYLKECRKGPIVITRNGTPAAVLIAPVDDDDLESLLLARNPRFLALLEKSEKSIREGKGLSWKEFWAKAEKLP
ncbi:MAG: type II toxin-antitoxin system Phd/YefM family antitoxin [Planctomycetes bacterium]|nr:type II toxin-antitoxin system Phd/YefM family antitoxin [Planctomycetota bacterium]